MTQTSDVVVVGGGIAGLTVALALADRGLGVHLIDSEMPGAASRASAGILAPSLEGLPLAIKSCALEARNEYPPFLAALRERTGLDVVLNRNGVVELAESEAELARLSSNASSGAELLDARALAILEPALKGHPGALFHPDDGAVDNVSLMTALVRAAAMAPGLQRHDDVATGLSADFKGASVVTSAGTRFVSRFLVLAAGAWAGEMPGLSHPLPVRPLRGQLLLLDELPLTHVTFGGGGYFVPRHGNLLVGATSEDTAFESHPTAEGLASLCAVAARALPALAGATVLGHWAGLRPVTPDGLPILGSDPSNPSLFYACGYSRNGILFAPWAATRLARALLGEPEPAKLELFSVGRFLI